MERRRAHLFRFALLPARVAFRRSIWRFLTQGPLLPANREPFGEPKPTPVIDRAYPRRPIARPASSRQTLVVGPNGYLGPPRCNGCEPRTAGAGQSKRLARFSRALPHPIIPGFRRGLPSPANPGMLPHVRTPRARPHTGRVDRNITLLPGMSSVLLSRVAFSEFQN